MNWKQLFRVVLVLIVLRFSSCNKGKTLATEPNFKISIQLKGLENNTMVYLKKREGLFYLPIDSTRAQNQYAYFEGDIDVPQLFGVFIDDISEGIFPIVEEGNIDIKGRISDRASIRISGTPLNDQLDSFKAGIQKITNPIYLF